MTLKTMKEDEPNLYDDEDIEFDLVLPANKFKRFLKLKQKKESKEQKGT